MSEMLSAQNLSVSLKGQPIVEKIDLSVQKGEMLGLLGPNGAGKTTLLKALAGLIPHDGALFLKDRPFGGVSIAERAQSIAYLAQQGDYSWPVSVRAAVALGRIPYQKRFQPLSQTDNQAIDRAMQETGIFAMADRRLDQLSGGERAKILLARALAVEAPLLLADEPAVFLDPSQQLSMLNLLKNRADAGDAVIVVLHDLTQAMRFCHRVAILHQGRLAAIGQPSLILTDQILKDVYNVKAIRGRFEDEDYLTPWTAFRNEP